VLLLVQRALELAQELLLEGKLVRGQQQELVSAQPQEEVQQVGLVMGEQLELPTAQLQQEVQQVVGNSRQHLVG
jgi:hypothetical protein